MLDIELNPNQGALDDLFSALDKAFIFTKRSPAEFCNTVLYFILRGAIAFTARGDKNTIRSSLLIKARIAPSAPIAAILINKKGEHGYNGARMVAQVEKFIRKRQATATYIPSRWTPYLKKNKTAMQYKAGN
jgi:hypothetical protein